MKSPQSYVVVVGLKEFNDGKIRFPLNLPLDPKHSADE